MIELNFDRHRDGEMFEKGINEYGSINNEDYVQSGGKNKNKKDVGEES